MTQRKTQPEAPPASELKSEFAARLGLTRGRVSQMIAAGLPVTDDGQVPVAEALAWVEANIHQAASGGGAEDLRAAKVRLTQAQAQLAELTAAEREGQLIDKSDARRLLLTFARLQRDTVLQFASREGPSLAAELGVEPRAMVAALDREMRNLLIAMTSHKLPFQDGGPDA